MLAIGLGLVGLVGGMFTKHELCQYALFALGAFGIALGVMVEVLA